MSATTRSLTVVVASALLATPAAAHGVGGVTAGVAFHLAVAGVVGVGLLGGGLVLAAAGRVPARPLHGAAVPVLVVLLGGGALVGAVARAPVAALVGVLVAAGLVSLGRGVTVTDGGACADATLGAVALHRTLEGVALAAIYASNAALGLAGAVVVGGHAAAETAAVGALYVATGRRRALGAVLVVQAGFVLGAVAGRGVVESAPPAVRAGVLSLVGSVLLAVGIREVRHRHGAAAEPTPA